MKIEQNRQGCLVVTPQTSQISPRLEVLSNSETMGGALRSIGSVLRRGLSLVSSSSKDGKLDVVVPGYSLESECEPAPVLNRKAMGLNRKAVGILYADIVDYARLSDQDEEGTHRRLVDSMHLMRAQVSAHNGRIAHYAGDAILAEFKDADSALHCAISVQLSARQWNASLDDEQQVRLRIGVNFGEVIVDQGDIYGNAVNLAARLENLADSGGICVSHSVRDELEAHPSYCFIAMGKRYVKNIDEPVQAYWIECESGAPVETDADDYVSKLAATQ